MEKVKVVADLAVAATALATGTPDVSAGLKGIGALGYVWTTLATRQHLKLQRLWQEIVEGDGADEATAAFLRGRLEDPDVGDGLQEIIESAFRSLLESLAPEVVAPLAMITREYARADRQPDRFFRGVTQALRTVTTDEFATFRRIVGILNEAAANCPGSSPELHIHFWNEPSELPDGDGSTRPFPDGQVEGHLKRRDAAEDVRTPLCDRDDVTLVLRILDRADLATAVSSFGDPEPAVHLMKTETLQNLHRILSASLRRFDHR